MCKAPFFLHLQGWIRNGFEVVLADPRDPGLEGEIRKWNLPEGFYLLYGISFASYLTSLDFSSWAQSRVTLCSLSGCFFGFIS